MKRVLFDFIKIFKIIYQVYVNEGVNESFLGGGPIKQNVPDGRKRTGENTSTGLSSDTFIIESRYFGNQLKLLRSKNIN